MTVPLGADLFESCAFLLRAPPSTFIIFDVWGIPQFHSYNVFRWNCIQNCMSYCSGRSSGNNSGCIFSCSSTWRPHIYIKSWFINEHTIISRKFISVFAPFFNSSNTVRTFLVVISCHWITSYPFNRKIKFFFHEVCNAGNPQFEKN